MRLIECNYTQELRAMKTGETVEFPVKAISSLKCGIIPRLRMELITEGADWLIGKPDPTTGKFKVKRISKKL